MRIQVARLLSYSGKIVAPQNAVYTPYATGHTGRMDTQLSHRQVVIPAQVLDDLAELARLASDRLDAQDQSLALSLRGAAAQARAQAVLEP